MIRLIAAILAAAMIATAAPAADPANWTQPNPPVRIAGNIWYVGTKGLASYLIVTPKGLILLDATLEENVPGIEANIRSLGYKLSDVKILLNSHAHFDHAGGLAKMKADTGAKLEIMDGDVSAIERGKHFGDQNYVARTFTPAKVDRVLKDGDRVELGGITLTALKTAGHTRGCTTWLTTVKLKIGVKNVVFPCSLTVAGNILVGNKAYPQIAADYRASFKRMAALKADIVLPAHPEFADVLERTDKDRIAPDLLGKIVAEARSDFEKQWRAESAKAK